MRHEKIGGFARFSGYFNQVRRERGADSVIALVNANTLHGTFPAVNSKGEAFIKPLNKLGLDACTFHRDIAYGPEKLSELPLIIDKTFPKLQIFRQPAGRNEHFRAFIAHEASLPRRALKTKSKI